jgi:hypothetical protein
MHPHSILTFWVQVGVWRKSILVFPSSLLADRDLAPLRWHSGRHGSILARLTTRPAMTLAGIVINCSRDERRQFCAFGRLEN